MGFQATHPRRGAGVYTLAEPKQEAKKTVRSAMQITVNGEPRAVEGPLNVAGLIAALGLDARKVAVERNREIVARSTYAEVAVAEGDAFEIVRFIGGG